MVKEKELLSLWEQFFLITFAVMTGIPKPLNEASSLERNSSAQEEKLVKDLHWLWDNIKENNSQERVCALVMLILLSGNITLLLYKKQNNALMAEITFLDKGFYKK